MRHFSFFLKHYIDGAVQSWRGPVKFKVSNLKFLNFGIAKGKYFVYNTSSSVNIALSPNGKATDSDSVISRFESL